MTFAAHDPVMAREIIAALAPRDNGVYVDATFGGGGYTRAILAAADCTVYGFDRDATAIDRATSWAGEYGDRLRLINRPFAEMEQALEQAGISDVDGVVFDLGVSSMQLDEAGRGFSFRHDGPLSMRMDGGRPDAADIVAFAQTRDLTAIFAKLGEEKKAGVIARAIIAARDEAPITTTAQLSALIEKAAPGHGKSKIHPATRAFQALRIYVNDELGQLAAGLHAAENVLRAAGRLVVVSFHSLEDRIVKRFFQIKSGAAPAASRHAPPVDVSAASFKLLSSKARAPGADEVDGNPRARSAKLRAGIRLDAASAPIEAGVLGAPTILPLKFLPSVLSLQGN